MLLRYRITFQDFLASLALHSKRNLFQRSLRLFVTYGFPIFGTIQWLTIFQSFSARDRADIFWTFFFGATLIAFPLWFRLVYWLHYRRTVSQSADTGIDLDSDIIRCKSAHSKSEIEWTGILRFAEDQVVFLLYTAPGKYLLTPKRACTDEQINELRALFQLHVALKEAN